MMNYRLLSVATLLALASWSAGVFAEPPPERVLVLTNDDTLAGRVARSDDGRYHIEGGTGEIVLGPERILHVCVDFEEAYSYLRARANLRDPDERLRLGRWCLHNGLRLHAKEEATATLRLRPGDEAAERMLRAADVTPPVKPATPPAQPVVRTEDNAVKPINKARPVSYPPDTIPEFTRRIQPILLNSCGAGSCHGNNGQHGYNLNRPANAAQLTANLTRQNLDRTLALVDPDDSGASVLLRKALETHGGATKPPLVSEESPAYQTLAKWVKHTVPPPKAAETPASDPPGGEPPPALPSGEKPGPGGFASERDDGPPAPKAEKPSNVTPKNERPPTPNAEAASDAQSKAAAPPATGDRPKQAVPFPTAEPAKNPPVKTGPSEDPFDPDIFNRQFHPKTK